MVACSRHRAAERPDDDGTVVVEVQLRGVPSQAVGDLIRRGATGVQVVGCAPADCAYGIGNELAPQRLAEEQAPHVARRFACVRHRGLGGAGRPAGGAPPATTPIRTRATSRRARGPASARWWSCWRRWPWWAPPPSPPTAAPRSAPACA
ncbi:MAG: hydrogenase iron-sulfur subunit [Acidimicrobiales bacterium]